MRILTAYCPHCDCNGLVTCVPEGETVLDGVWVPAVVLRCAVGHPLLRFGAVGGADPVLDLLLGRLNGHALPHATTEPA